MNSISPPSSPENTSISTSTPQSLLSLRPLMLFCREQRTYGEELASLEVIGRTHCLKTSIEPDGANYSNFSKTSVLALLTGEQLSASRFAEVSQKMASTLSSLGAYTLPERGSNGIALSTPQYRVLMLPWTLSLEAYALPKLWRSSRHISKKDYETIYRLRSLAFSGALGLLLSPPTA